MTAAPVSNLASFHSDFRRICPKITKIRPERAGPTSFRRDYRRTCPNIAKTCVGGAAGRARP